MPAYTGNGRVEDNHNKNNYGIDNKVSDISNQRSNPCTIPGNPVCVEKLHGHTNSRKNITPRQSSNMPEMSRNSTAKFGRDDDRIAGKDKKGGPLTRFIGFCNKKNPQ